MFGEPEGVSGTPVYVKTWLMLYRRPRALNQYFAPWSSGSAGTTSMSAPGWSSVLPIASCAAR